MKLSRFLILPAAALLLAGCAIDDAPTENSRPAGLSGVRFIHAMSDEGGIDARMYDQTSWSSYALGINFRQSGAIQPTEPGTRMIRVFRASTDVDEIDDILIDQSVTIPAGEAVVTLLLTGSVQAGTANIQVITESVPDSTSGSTHYRAFNATGSASEVIFAAGDGSSAPVTVGPLSSTGYSSRSVSAGALTASFFDAADPADTWEGDAPAGAPENNGIGATAGHTASGSALVAYLFEESVVGSRAPQGAAFQGPGVIWFVDRVPAPPRF